MPEAARTKLLLVKISEYGTMPSRSTWRSPYTSPRNASRARTRWTTPASMWSHSSSAIRRGTRSSGKTHSSPDDENVIPCCRKLRARTAPRSSRSPGDSSSSASYSDFVWARGAPSTSTISSKVSLR